MNYERSLVWLMRVTVLMLIFLCGFLLLKLKPIWLPLLQLLSTIVIPLLIAAFITYLLHPIIESIHNHRVPRWLAVLFIFLLFFGGMGLMVIRGLPHLVSQLQLLAENAPQLFSAYQNLANQFISQVYDLPEMFHDRIEMVLTELQNYLDQWIERTIDAIKEFINSLFLLLIIPFLVFYFLKDIDKMKVAAWYFTPKKWRRHGQRILKEIDLSLGRYIRGQLLVIFILCVMASTSFWLIDLPYPVLLGTIVGIADIVPYFGPIIGAIPVIFIAMTISLNMVFWVIGIMIGLHFLEGNVLSPLIVGKSLQMHPVVIILALLVGGEVAGIIGMILAVPLFAVARVVISYFHRYYVKH